MTSEGVLGKGSAGQWPTFGSPRFSASLGEISAEVAVALPLVIDNSALQSCPIIGSGGAIAIRF
ncbi:MAG TPA: hypothetical protein VGF73_06210 [Chthoniobacterales bacterium]|jgi:hypothetical protein